MKRLVHLFNKKFGHSARADAAKKSDKKSEKKSGKKVVKKVIF